MGSTLPPSPRRTGPQPTPWPTRQTGGGGPRDLAFPWRHRSPELLIARADQIGGDLTVAVRTLPWIRTASVPSALAAIDVEDFASHKAGCLQVEDGFHNVRDLPHMADRMQVVQLGIGFRGIHRTLDYPWGDSIHANAAFRIFDGQRLRCGVQAALGHRGQNGWYSRIGMIDEAGRDLHDVAA